MSAAPYPRDGEPFVDEGGESWRGVPWLVGAFYMLAIVFFGVLLGFLLRWW